MAYRSAQTVDDLLADALIQKVMRADRVEPQALKNSAGWDRSSHRRVAACGLRADRAGSRSARLVPRAAALDAACDARNGRRVRSIPLRLTLLR